MEKKGFCVLSVLVIVISLLSSAFAEADYSFLDNLNLAELEALQLEVNSRIAALQSQTEKASADDLGIWELRYYVDEFDIPTNDGYICNANLIEGRNSGYGNIANLRLLIDMDGVSLALYNGFFTRVTNYYSTKKEYDVSFLDTNGKKYSMVGYYYSKEDRMYFDYLDSLTIIDIICQIGEIRLSINEQNGVDSFLFVIPNASGFMNAYVKLVENGPKDTVEAVSVND